MAHFWSKQPVPQSLKELTNCEANKQINESKLVNYNQVILPENLFWYNVDIDNLEELDLLYCFLRNYYVGNDEYRFNYSKNFIQWALKPPGYKPEWILSIRSCIGKKPIVGFISATPATISIHQTLYNIVEINYLCLHPKVRNNNLTPILIKEITRRANIHGIWQAVYTAGVTLPTPISTCTYHHRPLNTKKLMTLNFITNKLNTTLTQNIKLYKLPKTTTSKLRPIEKLDCDKACLNLNNYLNKYTLHTKFFIDDFEHWFISRENVIETYVVEDPVTHDITDMVSYYIIPSTILNNIKYTSLYTAYLFYYFNTKMPLTQLIKDILIIANNKGLDVFNCLDVHNNSDFINELKFKTGCKLNYYLYNYLTKPINPNDIGLILL